jgi:CheY-like chemotaxis protein
MSSPAAILVVDDEGFILTMLSMRLRDHGYSVTIARNGKEALQTACENPPDLIITDYQMPILNGVDFAHTLRADSRTENVPVIMLTARGHKLSVAELKSTNIRHVLPKPFSAREVLALTDELLMHERAIAASVSKDKAA